MSKSLIRKAVRSILSEDVYDKGAFSPNRLRRSLERYASGELSSMGVHASVATDLTLDDLLVAFGESGHDSDSALLMAIDDNDRRAAENRIREILNTEFIGRTGPLSSMNLRSLDDILLPGDEDELVSMILNDMFDGDEIITTY